MPQPSNPARLALTDWRQRSLVRANLLVLGSLLVSFWLSDFPHNRLNYWLAIPLLCAIAGTVDTCRNMRTRWSWYHGGVVLCAYMDLMAVLLIAFFLIYPLFLQPR
jgi:hypothetical protein